MPRITQAQYEEQGKKLTVAEADRDAWREIAHSAQKSVEQHKAASEEVVKKLAAELGEKTARIEELERQLAEAQEQAVVKLAEVEEATETRVTRVGERAESVLQTTILSLMGAFFVVNSIVWSLRCNDPNEL